jgi:hypothetical protein
LSQDYNLAFAYVAAFAGDANTAVVDWRAIHDTRKNIAAIPFRGTVAECWSSMVHYNNQGYGIFAVVAMMDGVGRELANVAWLRANYIDLDEADAQQQFERAAASHPAPSFYVNSSPGKFHVYWPTAPYVGNDRFQVVQRKLRQIFNGDRLIIDATRVMRVPGTLHLKNPQAPHLVTCGALAGYGQTTTVDALEQALAGVNIIDGGSGARHDLGEPSLAAPSLDWIKRALELVDPNDLDRGEWIALTSAIKQAGWTLTDDVTLFGIWSGWCAKYAFNDLGENTKQWNSIRNTELGWQSMVNRVPSLRALVHLDGRDKSGQIPPAPAAGGAPVATVPPMPEPPPLDCSGPVLTHIEQQQYFKDCVFVVNLGLMMTPKGRFLNVTQFNAAYGGKKFIIDEQGKFSNEAWAAATRSTLWTVPKVDHVRFLPERPFGELIEDDLGRLGVNTYKPAVIRTVAGDVTPFLNHMAALLPNVSDQATVLAYMAHNVKYPGVKIPWAPLIQSTEGAGKGVLKRVIQHAMGRPYVYFPKASELSESGAKFNAWLRNKLFILVDEIKVDDRRELIEVLKPLISEHETEIQSKGVDQDIEDNFSNWLFFSNFKDAIPINRNARRFAIFYSPLQTVEDLIARQMGEAYFNWLYQWLEADGAAIVADYLMNYPIARGALPMRAPDTSSTREALEQSRSPVERLILEGVEDQLPGFRGGWVSATMVARRVKETGATNRALQQQTIATILESIGYVACGRAPRAFFQEDKDVRPYLFHFAATGDVSTYGRAQGWE